MTPLLAIAGGEEGHGPPPSLFTPIWEAIHGTKFGEWMEFDVTERHLGQFWFEGIVFSILSCTILILLAFLATRRLERVPRGLQGLFELAINGFRSMAASMMGPQGDRYVPFLGTTFLLIFFMNLAGIFPWGRSPTLALSITLGMGITAFLLVQYYSFRDAGFVGVMKHLMGPVWWLAPLIFAAELISELVRPVSLSMRLYGNIYGEDNVIEAFMNLGGWVPLQLPILFLALLTSFLQAYIFTMLCTYYIASKVVHEEHGEAHGADHGHDEKAEAHPAPAGAHH